MLEVCRVRLGRFNFVRKKILCWAAKVAADGPCVGMQANWLSDRTLSVYNDILDHCADTWNKLAARPWAINSIGMRTWVDKY